MNILRGWVLVMSSFRCLAIETATSQPSIAVATEEQVCSVVLSDSRNSSRQLYQSINQLLNQAELRPDQLDCVAFGCGPGSFTGVRVAAGAAQALAYANSVPVCRVSTLAALALAGGLEHGELPVAACLDAGSFRPRRLPEGLLKEA